MPLDDLVQVIETLQQRIRDHGDSLRQNEMRTRVALIDPLLTALGWDVADPGLVTAEYDVSGQRVDYALLSQSGLPSATIEAKKLGEGLASHRMQMLNYSNAAGIAYAGLTDGNHWELYEVFKQVTLEERRILQVSIADEPAYKIALSLLLLWRPNLASGHPVEASEPIFTSLMVSAPIVDTIESEIHEPTVIEQMPVIQPNEKLSGVEWTSLAEYRPKSKDSAPSAVLFPNGEERPVGRHKRLLIEVAEYLIRIQQLTADKCPIGSGHVKYVVNSVQMHKDGSNYRNHYMLSNGLHLETKDPAPQTTKSVLFLLQHFGQDPASVWLKSN